MPLHIEFLEQVVTDINVLLHLCLLNVRSHFVLETDDVALEKSNFFHEVLVELVLMNLHAFFSKQLHLFLGALEDHDLLIFVQDTVTARVEDV